MGKLEFSFVLFFILLSPISSSIHASANWNSSYLHVQSDLNTVSINQNEVIWTLSNSFYHEYTSELGSKYYIHIFGPNSTRPGEPSIYLVTLTVSKFGDEILDFHDIELDIGYYENDKLVSTSQVLSGAIYSAGDSVSNNLTITANPTEVCRTTKCDPRYHIDLDFNLSFREARDFATDPFNWKTKVLAFEVRINGTSTSVKIDLDSFSPSIKNHDLPDLKPSQNYTFNVIFNNTGMYTENYYTNVSTSTDAIERNTDEYRDFSVLPHSVLTSQFSFITASENGSDITLTAQLYWKGALVDEDIIWFRLSKAGEIPILTFVTLFGSIFILVILNKFTKSHNNK